jgi:nitrate reductase gamma subunit
MLVLMLLLATVAGVLAVVGVTGLIARGRVDSPSESTA